MTNSKKSLRADSRDEPFFMEIFPRVNQRLRLANTSFKELLQLREKGFLGGKPLFFRNPYTTPPEAFYLTFLELPIRSVTLRDKLLS